MLLLDSDSDEIAETQHRSQGRLEQWILWFIVLIPKLLQSVKCIVNLAGNHAILGPFPGSESSFREFES